MSQPKEWKKCPNCDHFLSNDDKCLGNCNQPKEWEKAFEEMFVKKPVNYRDNHGWTIPYVDSGADKVKAFIQQEIDEAYKKGVIDTYNKINSQQ